MKRKIFLSKKQPKTENIQQIKTRNTNIDNLSLEQRQKLELSIKYCICLLEQLKQNNTLQQQLLQLKECNNSQDAEQIINQIDDIDWIKYIETY